jgi:hypothetical protein
MEARNDALAAAVWTAGVVRAETGVPALWRRKEREQSWTLRNMEELERRVEGCKRWIWYYLGRGWMEVENTNSAIEGV